ncbi:MAG TPA: HEAT repeat domain-containing protein [Gemmatimonadales bacterium]|nr:HEAT repeat domain-containing protein [Gemmatimonadales bacterium]
MPAPAERLALLDAAAGAGAEDAILAALEDDAPVVRERAVRLAARYVEPQVLGAMVADGVNAGRRNGALAALERQGPYAVPHLAELLQSPDAELVMFALQILARIGDPVSTARVLPLVAHHDPNVAQAAVETLGRMRVREALPALLELLSGNLWLQLAAVNALGEIGEPAAVGPLLALVPHTLVAEQAVQALQRIAAPESLEPLLALLASVRERPLRDAILEAAAVVLELHPDSTAIGRRFGRESERGEGGVSAFLGGLLRTAEDDGDGGPLAQAAAALVLVCGFRSLYPRILRRVGDPEAPWAEPLWRRHAELSGHDVAGFLAHPDPAVRRGVLLAGWFGPDDLPTLTSLLADGDPGVRAAAARAIGCTGDARAAPALVAQLRNGGPEERGHAAAALGELPAEALAELRSCLDPRVGDDVVAAALGAVRLARAAAFESEVLAFTRSPSPPVRIAALRAAAALPGTRAQLVLVRALADRDEQVQVEALELLVIREGARAATTLIALLSAEDSLRFRVIRALGQLRAPEAASKLEALYPTAPLHERIEIVRALAAIAPAGVADFLRVRLRAQEPELRHVAALGLAQTAGPEEIQELIAMAAHEDWAIRNEAARGLGRLGVPEARPPLLTLSRDLEPVVARTARQSLAGTAQRCDSAAA